ncbi:Holliday junction branch migration protein RuvA [Fluoribacter dumoffii]|uniref:Holliday junction branch migration complex subunit RuvA n=1 Tax=Fluoribacter dumoffii TaxID=463 RepID=A0A377G8J4_9GAMM|nr:Holliday junction branch migration protein RuvA [Fluoribacter dumoffii]KTC90004.1 holliday junction DNA helicase [Fluoribacter dumoffii NY 23]MCW8385302.1 Holliday junction branch migration protein RuvA [Fluoribacter dumoffii]MCW8418356.1 Holliday junction branch migration protein RuvA [Fluoribacter dumoffii]MCW8453802.1 Holliday junction branch migration protein RuvA [Fluoribacter dumoffii]MCW8462127.1 Holliday junction branch migration protein RuvA [Fluoribacter dumoffii]
MIGWLDGHIIDKHQPGKLVLNVHGVGYDVETSLNTFFQLDNTNGSVGLYIHTVVREDALLLYGFLERQERELFRALIKVNGIGPKVAMSILSSTTPNEFIQCIQQENASFLMKLPGIGKKTAERLVVEMRDSIKQFSISVSNSLNKILPVMSGQDEAISALEALGYKPQEALKAVNKINDGSKSCEQLIRDALQVLAIR